MRSTPESKTGLPGCLGALAVIASCWSAPAPAQAWKPERNVEIVVPSAPGGSNDKTARAIEKGIAERRITGTSVTVVNRPGGGGTIAMNYLTQQAGNGHVIAIAGPSVLTNHIAGISQHNWTDYTPIANLFSDYVVFVVRADTATRTGADLVARLRKDPRSVSTAFATTLGSHNHIAAGLVMKAIGQEARAMKAVAFKGSAEAVTALLGGHVELVTTAGSNVEAHVKVGKLRVLAVAAPKRLGGALADVPTWKEQGVDVVFGGWRSIFGPKGLTPAQVAFWDGVLGAVVKQEEWQRDLERNYWTAHYVSGAAFAAELKEDYSRLRGALTDLGLVK